VAINRFKLGGESLTMHCSRRPSAAAECWTLAAPERRLLRTASGSIGWKLAP
jgi:hypothetical protein